LVWATYDFIGNNVGEPIFAANYTNFTKKPEKNSRVFAKFAAEKLISEGVLICPATWDSGQNQGPPQQAKRLPAKWTAVFIQVQKTNVLSRREWTTPLAWPWSLSPLGKRVWQSWALF
jgi:hypothetical protein